ncbi:hypothetical protein GALL_57620 [mine drainage metagenome]|uniref:Uncharacterized protein n=1 Tax=mine drainage metagenome TaxID=410659 RepID=A0A1J5SW42_9ZZZZ
MSKVYEALFLSWVLSASYLFVGFFGSSSKAPEQNSNKVTGDYEGITKKGREK